MVHRSLAECVVDLTRSGKLREIDTPLDPDLEIPAITRRVYAQGGPALLFRRVAGTNFPVLGNLFGTLERARYIFRETFDRVAAMIAAKAHPDEILRRPWKHFGLVGSALHALPQSCANAPIVANTTEIEHLPGIRAWPRDGGPFITLPQVYSEDLELPGPMHANVGMYRVQLRGNDYIPNREIGLHYQIHRGIGVHHQKAIARGVPLKVSIFVGGPPAHTLAAVMPLPEGLSELVFAGMLAGRRFRYLQRDGHVLSADADFVITGTIDPRATKAEGPFGDHLGYYSLKHDFPVMTVDKVYHRNGAIWPFTVVGRPPQEDTTFGALIHELTAPMVPVSIPGLVAMHAVDAAGVHPLLLAIGRERYAPYARQGPQELLTIANAILGFGQASLAKYLWISDFADDPSLDLHESERFFTHMLERVDWRRDLHFQTRTTIDTLDYSGEGLNAGSKVVIAASGPPLRQLCKNLPTLLSTNTRLPTGFDGLRMVAPGIVAVNGPSCTDDASRAGPMLELETHLAAQELPEGIALWIVVDDSEFCSRSLANWLWVTFTRSNPSHDIYGVGAKIVHKHWGCTGPLIIDARHKPHHAPALIEDPEISKRVDRHFAPGGALHGLE
jgi:4-hydroxy-3-polyprenylbenzoate decarboxylase